MGFREMRGRGSTRLHRVARLRLRLWAHNAVAHSLCGWCLLIAGRVPAWAARFHDRTAGYGG